MTIGKGTSWGAAHVLPHGAPILSSDSAIFHWLNAKPAVGEHGPGPIPSAPLVIGLSGGSLWAMLGGGSCVGRVTSADAIGFPCDVIDVQTDAGRFRFAASLSAHTRTWSRVVLAMNVQDLGRFRFGHRAHPGDGLVDIYEAELPAQQRFLVAKRARLGAHLPHPGIRERRVEGATLTLARPLRFWLDGVACGRSSSFALKVLPDALTVIL